MNSGRECLNPQIQPLGDSAFVIRVGNSADRGEILRTASVARSIKDRNLRGVVDVVPAFQDVAVYLAHSAKNIDRLLTEIATITRLFNEDTGKEVERTVELPVFYGGERGCDLEEVARFAGLSTDDVISLHTRGEYTVQAIGFSPGFAYLKGLAPALCMPRRSSPRPRIAAGSVGIGGTQTGVYTLPTPGGWNLIGHTGTRLFDPNKSPPALLRVGDRVRFRDASLSGRDFPNPSHLDESPSRPAENSAARGIRVLRPGMWTTVQDLGRPGYRADGVPLGGAADPLALRVANLLAGNPESAAGIEFTMTGPELEFECDAVAALAGAPVAGLPYVQPFLVRRGQILQLKSLASGCRGYLAISGGIDVPFVLGSRSTYVEAGLGGLDGGPLRTGDVLPLQKNVSMQAAEKRISRAFLPAYSNSPTVRLVAAQQFHAFKCEWLERTFEVSPQSNRMGVRLKGGIETRNGENLGSIPSSPVVPGTVQVPPDGNPIVLLADAQTVGGYPQIGTVITADIPLVAQLKPGDSIKFELVSVENARRLLFERERDLGLLRLGLRREEHAH
jgi:KipI family sensor histidine kinase inhibitor